MSDGMLRRYLVEVECVGVRVAARLGELPIFECLDGLPCVVRRSVGAEIVAGKNLLGVELAWAEPVPADEADGADGADEPPYARVSIFGVAEGTDLMRSDLVIEATWLEEMGELPRTGAHTLLRHRFGTPGPPGGVPWGRSDPIRAEDRGAIVGFIIELHQALTERNVARAVALMHGVTHGRADADGVEPERAAADLTLELETVFDDPRFEPLPIALPALTIAPLRDGRVACVRNEAGAPAIMARLSRGFWHRAPVVSIAAGKVTMWS